MTHRLGIAGSDLGELRDGARMSTNHVTPFSSNVSASRRYALICVLEQCPVRFAIQASLLPTANAMVTNAAEAGGRGSERGAAPPSA